MIYLDLDGPMVNFEQGIKDLLNKNVKVKPGQEIHQALGISRDEMWREIKKVGAKWWANLDPQPWAEELYDELCKIDEVMILTAPSRLPEAHAGKAEWMHRFFGKRFREYIMTKHKWKLARPGDVLIDDWDGNIEAFTEAGGIGITFPCPWNKAHKDTKDAFNKVLDDLSFIYPKYTPPSMRDDLWV